MNVAAQSSDDDDDRDFVVHKIMDHRRNDDGSLSYLVCWEGFGDQTWEPACHFKNGEPLADYLWNIINK